MNHTDSAKETLLLKRALTHSSDRRGVVRSDQADNPSRPKPSLATRRADDPEVLPPNGWRWTAFPGRVGGAFIWDACLQGYQSDPLGFSLRLRTPTKLGFKLPKWIVAIEVTDAYRVGNLEDRRYDWFGGL